MGVRGEGWLVTKTSLVGKLSLHIIHSIYRSELLLGFRATRDRSGCSAGVKSRPPQARTTRVPSIMFLMLFPGTLVFPNA